MRRVRADGAIPILQNYGSILKVPENENYMLRYAKLLEYNETIRQIAREESTIFIDHEKYWLANAADEETLKLWMGEAIHPGSIGHLEMAKLIFQTFNTFDPESPALSVSPTR